MIFAGIVIIVGFIPAIYFVAYFIAQECINENSHSTEVLNEPYRACQEPNKKVKSLEAQPTKVKSFQLELVETSPIPEDILQCQESAE